MICATGLSPRVRGNPARCRSRSAGTGSIPACAGETAYSWKGNTGAQGLSPRVRGEPRGRRAATTAARVYPRVCGGTDFFRRAIKEGRGLSPRVRGNRGQPNEQDSEAGSIPACAGEPSRCASRSFRERVYPRVCGGTFEQDGQGARWPGLSPRVRGNRLRAELHKAVRGSIPACAGEPGRERRRWPPTRVYPRVCGGTRYSEGAPALVKGLSPRVRGNRRDLVLHAVREGSIPACAGEPAIRAG